jgi:hypothetical protein
MLQAQLVSCKLVERVLPPVLLLLCYMLQVSQRHLCMPY